MGTEARQMDKFTDAELDDLIENPAKYGAPSWEEFQKHPEKFRKRKDHLFAVADASSKKLGKVITKQVYWMDGVKCDTPEKAQETMYNLGITPDELQLKIDLEDIGGQKAIAHIYFKRKSNLILPEGM